MSPYYSQFSSRFLKAIDSLKGSKAAVLGHLRPDGDCIGSQIALCRCLNALGIETIAVNPEPVPRNLRSFVADTPFFTAADFIGADGVAITVDCADAMRISKGLQKRFPKIFANIDHHLSNDAYATYNFVHPESSATAEILAGLFLDNKLPIDPVTAQALYVGIATDTGQFRFPSTTHEVFQICCQLVEQGAKPAAAAMELYEQESIHKLKLLERFLASLKFECEGRVCVGLLKNGIYEETGATKEDAEGLVDYTRAIYGVAIGVLLEERNGAIKGSFRAKDPVHRVDRLAQQFNGGGHACAAGFNLNDTLDHFYPRLIAILQKHFKSLGAA